LTTWLHRIVVNEALMWLRSDRRRRARIADEAEVEPRKDPSPSPAERLLSREATARVRAGLERLEPQDREVLVACHLEGASYRQYGLRVGLGPGAAKSRAFRARRALGSELRARA
jgi:RNA polymerase sigma-70 factor (ECF subfamily)